MILSPNSKSLRSPLSTCATTVGYPCTVYKGNNSKASGLLKSRKEKGRKSPSAIVLVGSTRYLLSSYKVVGDITFLEKDND